MQLHPIIGRSFVSDSKCFVSVHALSCSIENRSYILDNQAYSLFFSRFWYFFIDAKVGGCIQRIVKISK